jgi:hypothetical protein
MADHLSGFPGRKGFIWLTDAVPLPRPCQAVIELNNAGAGGGNPLVAEKFEQMLQALNQDDVAVYPIDARGLFSDPDFDASREGRPPFELGASGSALSGMNCIISGMIYLAQQTGGRAFYNTNGLAEAMRTALDDSELTYTLGYYPSHGQWNGEYRPIKVRVKREGVGVRYREGYFAGAETQVENKDGVTVLKEAAQNPLEATGVGVTVRLRPFKSTVGEQLKITVSVDPHDLAFDLVNGRWTGLFDVWAAQYSQQGKPLGAILKTASWNLKEEDYQQVMREGLSLTFNEMVKRGAEELRVVVRDAPSGSLGSVKVPLRKLVEESRNSRAAPQRMVE